MRVVKKEKRIKEVEVILEDFNVCDKCNCKIKKESSYDSFICEFAHKTGNNYPDGGTGKNQEMELCQKCAVKCVELLRTNGYRVTDSEWDW